MMGVPCKTRSCFGRSAFMRRPKPAAAIIAPTFIMTIYQRKIGRGLHGLRGYSESSVRHFRLCLSLGRGRALRPRLTFLAFLTRHMVRNFAAFFLVPAENHFAGGGLQHAGDRRFNG